MLAVVATFDFAASSFSAVLAGCLSLAGSFDGWEPLASEEFFTAGATVSGPIAGLTSFTGSLGGASSGVCFAATCLSFASSFDGALAAALLALAASPVLAALFAAAGALVFWLVSGDTVVTTAGAAALFASFVALDVGTFALNADVTTACF